VAHNCVKPYLRNKGEKMKKKWNRRELMAVGACATLSPRAFAQVWKKKNAGGASGDAAAGADGLMPAGSFIKYIAIASDLGNQGTMQLLSLYPPEKIEQIKKACEAYSEARRQNKGGEPDSDTIKLCSQALQSATGLSAEVDALNEEKKKALSIAHKKVSLMLLADAFAALNGPAIINRLNSDIQSISSNPMKARSLTAMKAQLQVLTFASSAIPGQIKAATSIRDVAKKIAEAQKVKLAENPSDKQVSTLDGLEQQAASSDVPPQG
jgi:hypothetical protein